MPLQPLQQLGNQLARSTTIFTDKALFDAVYQAMGGERRSGTLDIQLAAPVGMRTWKQVIIGRPGITDQAKVLERRDVLFTDMVQKESLATMKRDAATGNARVKIVAPPLREQASLDMARAAVARPEVVRMMAQPARQADRARAHRRAPCCHDGKAGDGAAACRVDDCRSGGRRGAQGTRRVAAAHQQRHAGADQRACAVGSGCR